MKSSTLGRLSLLHCLLALPGLLFWKSPRGKRMLCAALVWLSAATRVSIVQPRRAAAHKSSRLAPLGRKSSICKQYVNYFASSESEKSRREKCKAPLFTPCCLCLCHSDNQHVHLFFFFFFFLLLGLRSHWSFDMFYRDFCTLKKDVSTDALPVWSLVVLLKQRLHENGRRVFPRLESTHWLNIMWQVGDKIGLIKIKRKGNTVIRTWWCCINAIFNGDSCNYDNFGPLAFWLRC